ncbi:MAG TPA: TetR/AcrR family transcriptional regulator [Pirellulales bacterium]|nr:TetR/AcrR family transcriptional regulator [Pirellulales bacterium]
MASSTDNQSKRTCEERFAARREEILAQAARLFAQHGYSDTDTQLLAETIGVGKGTVYRYFASKRELFLAAADRVMRELRDRVDTSIIGIDEPFVRIETAIRAFLAFFAENPEFVELLIQERAQFKDRKKPTFIEHREANIGRWQELYRQLIADGRLRDMPVQRISDVISHQLYGTIFFNYVAGQVESVDAQTEAIVDVIFNGILTVEERRARRAAHQRAAGEPGAAPGCLGDATSSIRQKTIEQGERT